MGIIASSLCAIISSSISCGDSSLSEYFKKVCSFNQNEEIYYFDSYYLYFKKLASELLGLRIILVIIKSLLYYGHNYYVFMIFKQLSLIYYLCMRIFDSLLLDILVFINDLINNNIQGVYL